MLAPPTVTAALGPGFGCARPRRGGRTRPSAPGTCHVGSRAPPHNILESLHPRGSATVADPILQLGFPMFLSVSALCLLKRRPPGVAGNSTIPGSLRPDETTRVASGQQLLLATSVPGCPSCAGRVLVCPGVTTTLTSNHFPHFTACSFNKLPVTLITTVSMRHPLSGCATRQSAVRPASTRPRSAGTATSCSELPASIPAGADRRGMDRGRPTATRL